METTAPTSGAPTPAYARATVADAMHSAVLTCDPATPLVTIAQRMSAERVHAIVMLMPADGAGERIPWAVVTDLDVLRHAGRAGELTAADVAGPELLHAHPDDRLEAVAGRMARRAATHAVVVDRERGRPVGVLSTLDIARVVGWGRD
jgi:CBS domain-containing protein